MQIGTVDEKVVVFSVGREEYAVTIAAVKEVVPWTNPTPVPDAPQVVEGVVNLRGDIIPVIDLGRLFRTGRLKANSDARIIVLEVGGQQAGFIVDDVTEVHTVAPDTVAPASPVLRSPGRADVIKAILKISQTRLVVMVDVERIMSNLDLG